MSYRIVDESETVIDYRQNQQDWHAFLVQKLATHPPIIKSRVRKLAGTNSTDARVKAAEEIAAWLNTFLRQVRIYLVIKEDDRITRSFEADIARTIPKLAERLCALTTPDDISKSIVDTLIQALQSVRMKTITSKEGYEIRLKIDELNTAMTLFIQLTRESPPATDKPTTPIVASPGQPLRNVNRWEQHQEQSQASWITPGRLALSLIFLGALTMSIARSKPTTSTPDLAQTLVTAHNSHSRSKNERLNVPATYIRHTGIIVQPRPPHHSIVFPTLAAFFAYYPEQLNDCFANTELHIRNSNDLANKISTNRNAHDLLARLSTGPEQHFTVWWTPTCSEITIAPGIHTGFAHHITPRPVTIVFGPQPGTE